MLPASRQDKCRPGPLTQLCRCVIGGGELPPGWTAHTWGLFSVPLVGWLFSRKVLTSLRALENHGSSGETYVHLDTTPVSHDRHSHFQMTLCSQVGPLKWGHVFAKSQGLEGIVAWLGKFQHHPESQETLWPRERLSGALGDGQKQPEPIRGLRSHWAL